MERHGVKVGRGVVEVGDEGSGVGWEMGRGAGGNCWEKWELEECRGEDQQVRCGVWFWKGLGGSSKKRSEMLWGHWYVDGRCWAWAKIWQDYGG